MKESSIQIFITIKVYIELYKNCYLSVILIDPVSEIVKTIILKCFQKNINKISKKKVTRHITEDAETSSDDSDESDEE